MGLGHIQTLLEPLERVCVEPRSKHAETNAPILSIDPAGRFSSQTTITSLIGTTPSIDGCRYGRPWPLPQLSAARSLDRAGDGVRAAQFFRGAASSSSNPMPGLAACPLRDNVPRWAHDPCTTNRSPHPHQSPGHTGTAPAPPPAPPRSIDPPVVLPSLGLPSSPFFCPADDDGARTPTAACPLSGRLGVWARAGRPCGSTSTWTTGRPGAPRSWRVALPSCGGWRRATSEGGAWPDRWRSWERTKGA